MSHVVAALLSFMFAVVYTVRLSTEANKDYAQAGVIVIDKVAYRLVKIDGEGR